MGHSPMGEWQKPFPWVVITIWFAAVIAGIASGVGAWILVCKLIDMFTG